MDTELYKYTRKQILAKKTIPFDFANHDVALEIFQELKDEIPTVSFHEFGIRQWICYDHRARKKLQKQLQKRIDERKKEIEELEMEIKKINT